MSSSPEVSYGIMADCQAADADDWKGKIRGSGKPFLNCYRLSPAKLAEAVETFNQYELDFIIHLGDFVDRDLRDAERLHRITGRAIAPLIHVIGNHELWVPGTKVEDIVKLYKMPSQYYSQSQNGNRFIALDTCDLGVLEHAEGSPEWKVGHALLEKMEREGAIQAYMWNGGLGERQLEWLDQELTNAEKHDEKATIFAHHPVFPPSVLNALNREEILEVIDKHDNVMAFINGHDHGGAYGERGGVPYVTMPGMLSSTTNAFAVAHQYADRLELKGFGRVEDRILWKETSEAA
jgi:manganese-dependent ADP-ribose/CDP-alcohol diphosphatase